MADPDLAAVAVTYNGLPWVEQCLESLRGVETVLVDHGSTDGTLELVRERFPEVRVIEQENKGLGAGWNAGMRAAPARYLPADQLGRVARRRGRSSASSRSPTLIPTPRSSLRALAEPGRHAAALRARLPDPLAGRDRVLLPAQARAAVARAERVLRGRLRHDETRPVEWFDGRVLPRPARGRRRRSASTTRTSSCSARRPTGSTASSEAGWTVWFVPDAEVDPRRRGDPRRPDVQRERPRPRALVRQAPGRRARRTRVRRLLIVALRLRGLRLPRRARAHVPRRRPRRCDPPRSVGAPRAAGARHRAAAAGDRGRALGRGSSRRRRACSCRARSSRGRCGRRASRPPWPGRSARSSPR